MSECEQTKGQSILDHGTSVKNYLFDLLDYLRNGRSLQYDWMLPDWVVDNKDLILKSLPDDQTLELYTTYHDCGKWKCLTIDDEGRRHFPDHARVSYDIFNQVFTNPVASQLILHDMDIHLLKSTGVEDFCKNPYALTLLIVGLAEIHSNCQMFGGLDSTSFKIKWKSINSRGKAILNLVKSKIDT